MDEQLIAAIEAKNLQRVEELLAAGAIPYNPTLVNENEFPGWFSIHVNTKRRQDIKTEELQNQFLQRGCFVYEPH